MSLKEELGAFAQGLSTQLPEEVLSKLSGEIGKLAKSGIVENALQIGSQAPEFQLANSKGELVSLNNLLEKEDLIVSFIRGNWCPFCDITFKHLQNTTEALKEASSNMIVISPQLPEKSAQLIQENGYDFEILYDKDNLIAKQFGIAFKLSEELKDLYQNVFQIPLEEFNGNSDWELPIPATFVIKKDGKISYASINPNWLERAEPSEYLASLN